MSDKPKQMRCEHAISGACKANFSCWIGRQHSRNDFDNRTIRCEYSPTGRARCVEIGVVEQDSALEQLKRELAPLTAEYVTPWRPDPGRPDVIIGEWAEDGSHYTLVVPTQLRPAIIAMQNALPRLLANIMPSATGAKGDAK